MDFLVVEESRRYAKLTSELIQPIICLCSWLTRPDAQPLDQNDVGTDDGKKSGVVSGFTGVGNMLLGGADCVDDANDSNSA